MSKEESIDRAYKLKRKTAPISFTLQSMNSKRKPLMHFDESKNQSRALRYSPNQKSPFEDEQKGQALLGEIVFEDGQLFVPRTNPVLQEFLKYTPDNGKKFEEVNTAKDAETTLDNMDMEDEARAAAKDMDGEMVLVMSKVIWATKNHDKLSSFELRRDLRLFAKTEPKKFLGTLKNPKLKMYSEIQGFLDSGILSLKNHGREVWTNTDEKQRVLSANKSEDMSEMLADFLAGEKGSEVLNMLRNYSEED
jgi:hypothetical protein